MSGLRILYHHRIRAEDGQAVHVAELISALRRAGHEVLECALVPKADPGQEDGTPSRGKASLWRALRLPRAAVEVMEVLYNQKGRRMLRAAARRFRPDLVYERHALHCRVGLDVSRELDVPLFLEVNSPMCEEMAELGLLRFPARARATERAVLSGADRVLPVTRVLADILAAGGARPESIAVIHNGAQPERYGAVQRQAALALRQRLGLSAEAFVLGFVGYVRPWHRLEMVLSAMARPELSGLHLMLVGSGPALPAISEQAAAAGLGQRLHTLGTVPPALLPAHVCAFDAALVPAINRYASPLKLFDYLAAGVVTLAPRQPNIEEVLTDGEDGVLFEPGSVESLVQELGALVRDRDGARRIAAAGHCRLVEQRWTWDGNAERVAATFRQLNRGDAEGAT